MEFIYQSKLNLVRHQKTKNMKSLKITLFLVFAAMTGNYAQEQKEINFHLSPETVEVYDFETSTKSNKGSRFQYEFEDDYTVKLTNKVYKIQLFYKAAKSETIQKGVSKILDGSDTSIGYEKMVWKKTNQSGKAIYEVELKDNKLRIEVIREQMNDEAYDTLNALGQEFIKNANS